MKIRLASLGRRAIKEESGQIFAITGLGCMLLVGLAGIAIEVGHGFFALEVLQASTNEATLAAATGLPDSTQAQTNANKYSSEAAQENAISILQNASATASAYCSATVTSTYGIACVSSATGQPAVNAVKVTQTAQSGLWIGKMFGTPLFNLKAVGYAAMDGETCKLCNIALVMDATGSMGNSDSASDCTVSNKTQENCALQGFRALLNIAQPCGNGQTCSSGSATPDDAVALFVFPAMTTPGNDTVCNTSAPGTVPYTMPSLATGTTYSVIPFSSGATFKTTGTSAPGLNSTDPLVYAAGGSTGQCGGVYPQGGHGTYYAQAIYQAGEALQAEQALRPGSKNVLILLSDGNATATGAYTWTGSNCTGTITGLAVASNGCAVFGGPSELQPTNGIVKPAASGAYQTHSQINGTKVPGWSSQANLYAYPSLVGQCGQAVQAAYDVATKQSVTYTTLDGTSTTYTLNNGTDLKSYNLVYTIAFGSPNVSAGSGSKTSGDPTSQTSSEGCYTDIPYNASTNYWTACTATTCTVSPLTTGGGSWPTPNSGETGIVAGSPCAALAAMASQAKNFFSDQGGSPSCPGADVNAGITSLTGIFTAIIDSLSSPKLIPVGTT
jgi:Flp pilus assembly protein TadG